MAGKLRNASARATSVARAGGVESPLRVDTRCRGSVVHMLLEGALDSAGSIVLTAKLDGVWSTRPALVMVDLRGLSSLEPDGLRLLIAARDHARDLEVRFVLVRGCAEVDRVLAFKPAAHRFEIVEEPQQILPDRAIAA